jgi:hypothetical protein
LRADARPGFVDLDRETVVARGREEEAGVLGPPPQDLGVAAFDMEGKDIGAVGDARHIKAGVRLQGGDDFLGCGDGLGVALSEAFEEMKRHGGEGHTWLSPLPNMRR